MKTLWLHKHDRERLIVFCNGWGMDECPFKPLQASAYDVLMCYDYSDLKPDADIAAIVGRYGETHLVGWSMGVWVAQHLFSASYNQFQKRIAVNGTLCPINDHYGIPIEIFSSTLDHFTESARLKFYRRMCRDRGILEIFLAHQPERKIEDQRQELEDLLLKTDCLSAEASIYTDVVIANHDLILSTSNQRRFWEQKNVRIVDGYHFLFYGWESWDALIRDPGKLSV